MDHKNCIIFWFMILRSNNSWNNNFTGNLINTLMINRIMVFFVKINSEKRISILRIWNWEFRFLEYGIGNFDS